jgi:hypothetical protein
MSTNKNPHHINLLVIGNKDWYESLLTILCGLDEVYTVEFISDIYEANARLWHNSYDILLLEEEFSKKYTIQLSKMSYAMSRPSIILCKNIFKILLYKFWKKFSKFTNKFVTSRQMIFFARTEDKDLLNTIFDLAHHHQYFDVITSEINSNFSIVCNE